MYDLAIRGGVVVTAGATFEADIAIKDEKIVQLGGSFEASAELDAAGMTVFPGGIDMHVHLSAVEAESGDAFMWADDFASGSRAAAAGGITTIGNMTFPRRRESLGESLARVAGEAARDSIVDFVLHPVLIDPTQQVIAEIPELARRGYRSVKIFMLGDFDSRASDFLAAVAAATKAGVLTLIHCEDQCIVSHVTRRLIDDGRQHVSNFAASRPVSAEWSAVTRAVAYAEATGASIYIVHLSSLQALEVTRQARSRGVRVFVETRPIYLHFTRERFKEPDGALYVGYPPLRDASDVEGLWQAIEAGHVQTCCTDHAPHTRGAKLDRSLTIETALPGMSDLETLMPLLYSEGVRKGRISLQRFVEVTSTNAARLFGLFPQKGTIAIDSDADLVIWDTERTRVVRASEAQSNAGFTLYEGWEVVGWPAATIRRGEIIYRDGRVAAHVGRGRALPCGPCIPV
jgi:dihydropyrimidinase